MAAVDENGTGQRAESTWNPHGAEAMITFTPEEKKVIHKFIEHVCISDFGVMIEFYLPKIRAGYEEKANNWEQRQEAAKILLAYLNNPQARHNKP